LTFIIHLVDIYLQKKCSMQSFYSQLNKSHEFPLRGYIDIFEKTKGGKMLFTIVSVYMLFTSITLPVINYYHAKRIRNGYFDDVNFVYFILKKKKKKKKLKIIYIYKENKWL